MSKCAECGGSAGVIAYCVECKKVLCRRCVGRLHFPGLKTNEHTIEELDKSHANVQNLTVMVLNVSVVVGAVVALWHAGLQDDYFHGAGTCPALGWGREVLARFDTNLFYYYKSSLATYCDIEDSFWRLLMDGWTRGIVTGSDSLLLLASTLPKALLFKTALSTFLRPIYAVFYAASATLIAFVITRFEDVLDRIRQSLPAVPGGHGGRIMKAIQYAIKLPGKLRAKIQTKSTIPAKARKVFLAIGGSGCLRLAFRTAGLTKLAALDVAGQKTSTWQLAFEPICFFYLAHLCLVVDKKLNKHVYAKKAGPPVAPLTIFRERPKKDVTELVDYCRERALRSFNYYRAQAEGVLHMIIDDTFNMVVFLRLISILFGLAPMIRSLLVLGGLGGLLDRHSSWFVEATGLEGPEAMFYSDRLLSWVEREVVFGVGKVGSALTHSQAFREAWHIWMLIPLLWRAALPLFLYFLETKWETTLKQQQDSFKKKWVGPDKSWKDGAYEQNLEKYGSFWMEVSKEDWVPLKTVSNGATSNGVSR